MFFYGKVCLISTLLTLKLASPGNLVSSQQSANSVPLVSQNDAQLKATNTTDQVFLVYNLSLSIIFPILPQSKKVVIWDIFIFHRP